MMMMVVFIYFLVLQMEIDVRVYDKDCSLAGADDHVRDDIVTSLAAAPLAALKPVRPKQAFSRKVQLSLWLSKASELLED